MCDKIKKTTADKVSDLYGFNTVFVWQSGTFGNFFVPKKMLGFA